MNTFEIQQEYRALEDLLNETDPETGEFINSEEDIEEYIYNLELDRNNKLDNIERLKREIQGSINTIDAEIKRLQQLKKQKQNNVERLTTLQYCLTNGMKVETELYKFSTRKSKSVHVPAVVDPSFKECVRTKYEWDKTAIKKMLESGVDYSEYDIYFEEKITLTVK